MKRIKEIMDSPEFNRHYLDFYTDEDILTARERLKSEGEQFKAYIVHLLQSGLDVIIGQQDYSKFKERIFIPQDDAINWEDYNGTLNLIPCSNPKDVRIHPVSDLITLSGVFCDGKWYDEFTVSKYGIEHIRELK